MPLATEGGHIGFAPQGPEEVAILEALARRFGRISVERILSGPGLENLARALDDIGGRAARSLSAAQIVEQCAPSARSYPLIHTSGSSLATFRASPAASAQSTTSETSL